MSLILHLILSCCKETQTACRLSYPKLNSWSAAIIFSGLCIVTCKVVQKCFGRRTTYEYAATLFLYENKYCPNAAFCSSSSKYILYKSCKIHIIPRNNWYYLINDTITTLAQSYNFCVYYMGKSITVHTYFCSVLWSTSWLACHLNSVWNFICLKILLIQLDIKQLFNFLSSSVYKSRNILHIPVVVKMENLVGFLLKFLLIPINLVRGGESMKQIYY